MFGRTRIPAGPILMAAVTLALVSSGCATTRGGEDSSSSDTLTREEIIGAEARNLYEVVQRLRPRWLTARATSRSFSTPTGVVVFQNNVYQGGAEVLRQFDPSAAYQLRYMDGQVASSALPGLPDQHVAGAILISTRPEGS